MTMTAFYCGMATTVYFGIGYELVHKWVREEQSYPLQDQSNTLGQVVGVLIWPAIVAARWWGWNDR